MADKTFKLEYGHLEGDDGTEVTIKGYSKADGTYTPEVAPVGPFSDTDSQITGQIVVATGGTPVAGPNVPLENGVFIKALGANVGKIYVGNNNDAAASDFSATDGFELSAGEVMIFQVKNLSDLYFDGSTDNDGVSFVKG